VGWGAGERVALVLFFSSTGALLLGDAGLALECVCRALVSVGTVALLLGGAGLALECVCRALVSVGTVALLLGGCWAGARVRLQGRWCLLALSHCC
jgi:hypothetical protein